MREYKSHLEEIFESADEHDSQTEEYMNNGNCCLSGHYSRLERERERVQWKADLNVNMIIYKSYTRRSKKRNTICAFSSVLIRRFCRGQKGHAIIKWVMMTIESVRISFSSFLFCSSIRSSSPRGKALENNFPSKSLTSVLVLLLGASVWRSLWAVMKPSTIEAEIHSFIQLLVSS